MYKPGDIWRQFIDIPQNVNSMVVRVKNCEPMDQIQCILQALQVRPLNSIWSHKMDKSFSLRAQTETKYAFELKTSRTLEVCFGQKSLSSGDKRIQLYITFHGLQPSLNSLTMFSSEMVARIDIQCNIDVEDIRPAISVNRFVQLLMPIEHKVRPLDSRDVIPPAQQLYEIMLTYNLKMTKGQDVYICTRSFLCDLTYGPKYTSLLWLIFNTSTKQYIGAGVDWPFKAITDNSARRLYYKQPLRPDTPMPIFIRGMVSYPPDIPISNGAYFTGRMDLADDSTRRVAEYFDFTYIIDSQSKLKSECNVTKVDENESKISQENQFNTAVSDLKISWVSKLKGKASEDLFNELRETDKTNVKLLLARIQALDSDSQRSQHLSRQICLANDVLDLCQINHLITSEVILKKEESNDENKQALKESSTVLEVLVKKGIAICDLIDAQNKPPVTSGGDISLPSGNDTGAVDTTTTVEGVPQFTRSDVNDVYKDICKLVADPYDPKAFKSLEWTHAEILI
ncbi:unnamed protein product [Oppiella nova]|uniref:Uncharacterized protein n=1 Tax=Oppiella nova TaxID=334625 RepID=A0A7R9LQZ9_9ACAR|nr:unnamed protein product [Oppiella nova]CAG2166113.1 unnamed protein product [Oppiella nova]